VRTGVRTRPLGSLEIPIETLAEISWKVIDLKIILEEYRKSCCIYALQGGKCRDNVIKMHKVSDALFQGFTLETLHVIKQSLKY